MRILVTGGYGFIGSHFICRALDRGDRVLNIDKVNYASTPLALFDKVRPSGNLRNIEMPCESIGVEHFFSFRPEVVVHFAAESHVDYCVRNPMQAVHSNVVGTANMLEASRHYWERTGKPEGFLFLHVSTDEVYGTMLEGSANPSTPYNPTTPYAATKAGADHLAQAYRKTYRLPVAITNCGNNYGPWQNPEKVVPKWIAAAINKKPVTIYGDGRHVRDWIHVEDHCSAIETIIGDRHGPEGRMNYCIGDNCELTNLDLAFRVCDSVDRVLNRQDTRDLIRFRNSDRTKFDDLRYSIDPAALNLRGWYADHGIEEGLDETVRWYHENREFIDEWKTTKEL